MKYGKLGRSNVTVSKICLGTMHFGNSASEEEAFSIMDRALEMGINFFDTANVYGGQATGRSEEIIGNWFAGRGPARPDRAGDQGVRQHGGCGSSPNEERGISAYKVRKHVADSLRRLQTDRIDLYQVHHIDRRISSRGVLGHLREAGGRRRRAVYGHEQLPRLGAGQVSRCKPGSAGSWGWSPSRPSTTC